MQISHDIVANLCVSSHTLREYTVAWVTMQETAKDVHDK